VHELREQLAKERATRQMMEAVGAVAAAVQEQHRCGTGCCAAALLAAALLRCRLTAAPAAVPGPPGSSTAGAAALGCHHDESPRCLPPLQGRDPR
jgi:hypothetical protein